MKVRKAHESSLLRKRSELTLRPAKQTSGRALGAAHAAKVRKEPEPVNSIFLLRALAAQELRRERNMRCRLAAADAAIRAGRDIDQWPNLQIADKAVLGLRFSVGRSPKPMPYSLWRRELAQRSGQTVPIHPNAVHAGLWHPSRQ